MASFVTGLTPMAQVADVERSIRFYQQLGLKVINTWEKDAGITQWASLKSGGAEIMFVRADKPVVASQQAVLFYMYSPNLVALRDHLLGLGVKVSAITYPFYMEKGEMQVDDPDGYCLLIGQTD